MKCLYGRGSGVSLRFKIKGNYGNKDSHLRRNERSIHWACWVLPVCCCRVLLPFTKHIDCGQRNHIVSAIRSLRPMRLKIVISLSSLRMRRVRRTSFSVEPLVVTSSITSMFCFLIVAHNSLSCSVAKRRKSSYKGGIGSSSHHGLW